MAFRSTGFEKRISKGEDNPSFFRTPTLSTPQCTNTARRWLWAHSKTGRAQSSWIEYPCIAGNRQATRTSENVAGRPALSARGFTMAYAKKRVGKARAAA